VHYWTQSAERATYENLVLFDDPDLASRFAREFQRLWRKAKDRYSTGAHPAGSLSG
jgi:hypothetical protein